MGYGQYSSDYRGRGSIKSNFSQDERDRYVIEQEGNNTWRFMDPTDPYMVTYRFHDTDIVSVRLVGPLDPADFKRSRPAGKAEWARIEHYPSVTTMDRLRTFCHRHSVPVSITKSALHVYVPLHRDMIPFGARSIGGHTIGDLAPHPRFEGFFAAYNGGVVTIGVESDSRITLHDVDLFRRAWSGQYDSSESPTEDLRHVFGGQGGVVEIKSTFRVVGEGVQKRALQVLVHPCLANDAPYTPLEFSLMTVDPPKSDRPLVFTPAPRQPIDLSSRASPQERFDVMAANAVQNWVTPHLKLGDSIGQITLTPHRALKEGASPSDTWVSHFTYDRMTHTAKFVTRAGLRGETKVWQRCATMAALIPAIALFATTLPEDVRTARFNSTSGLNQYGEMAELYARLDPKLVGYDKGEVPAPVMLEAMLKEWPMALLTGLVQLHESGRLSNFSVVQNAQLFVSMDPTKNPILRRDIAWANT